MEWLPAANADSDLLALIKPQFEAGRRDVSRGSGVIRDPLIHRQVLLDVLSFAQNSGLGLRGLLRSPVLGPKGNIEFLAWLSPQASTVELSPWIDSAIPPANG
jgi:23S rRNA (cytidine1920-2'-O)/16S rRNA (cytidine1409-2'-O)-methyltransferase